MATVSDQPKSREKVLPFIEEFGVDPDEFVDHPEDFCTFNEFFFRKLKAGVRPIAGGGDVACFPADGRHFGLQDLSTTSGIFAKGQRLQLAELLGDSDLAQRYREGTAVISRLCPVDYHRFHFPVSGTAGEPRLINGQLFSVSPIALRLDLSILWRNKRTLTKIESATFGEVLMIEVGATCVGGPCKPSPPAGRWGRATRKGISNLADR